MTDSRMPPNSPEAEQSVLGCMLLAPITIPLVMAMLSDADFYDTRYRIIWNAVSKMYQAGEGIDSLLVADRLKSAQAYDKVGGAVTLAGLMETVPSTTNAVYYAGIVRRKSLLRRLIALGSKAVQDAYVEAEVEDMLDALQSEILGIAGRTTADPVFTASQLTNRALTSIESGDEADKLRTLYPTLDNDFGGIRKGELTIIAARPSMGKSSLATNILLHVALAGGRVMVFSTEVTPEQLVQNMVIIQSGIPVSLLRGKGVRDSDWSKAVAAAGKLNALDILIDSEQPVTINRVVSVSSAAHQAKPVDLVVVDYIQDMAAPQAETRDMELARIIQPLKAMLLRLRCSVLAISQLNRKAEDRQDKRPRLADLRESGSLEQAADKVLLLYRPGYYDRTANQEHTELIVAKNRNGATGIMDLRFLADRITFQEPARGGL